MFAKRILFAFALAVSMACSASAFTQSGSFAGKAMIARGGAKAAIAPK
jgi:hypothetical protein